MVGTHYPKFNSTDLARNCGRRIWSSEDGPWKGTWEGATVLAKMFNRNYAIGRMTKTIIWSLITSYYENLPLPKSGPMKANTPWSGHYEVPPALWAIAHTTQFAQPGWQYLDDACVPLEQGSVVALASPNRRMGVWFMMEATRSSVSSLRFCSAGKKPGRMALTRIP